MSLASLTKNSSASLPLALDRINNNNNNNNAQYNNNNNNGKELQIRQHHVPPNTSKSNQVGTVVLYGVPIVSLVIDQTERLCLAQISNTLLKAFSYNEIHNRRVALGITCVQCTPVQLEILRRAGAMPVSSRRCGMITRREAERLCKSFLGDNSPPRLPDDFAFAVHHECAWGCRGSFLPSRYNSSRAKCIKCAVCGLFFSPNKFIFHSHRSGPAARYVQPDAANFNSWRRHMRLSGQPPEQIVHAWEDVKAMFNGGTRKRLLTSSGGPGITSHSSADRKTSPGSSHLVMASGTNSGGGMVSQKTPTAPHHDVIMAPFQSGHSRVPSLPLVMDYVWHHAGIYPGIKPYCLPWLTPSPLLIPPPPPPPAPAAVNMTTNINNHVSLPDKEAGDHHHHTSAFRPVFNPGASSPPSRFHILDSPLSAPQPLASLPISQTPYPDSVKSPPMERSPASSSRSRSEQDEADDYMNDHAKGTSEERMEGIKDGEEANEVGGREDEEEDEEETVDIETCPEEELKPNPFVWADNEKKQQHNLLQGSDLAQKQDVSCEVDRKFAPPFQWTEPFLGLHQDRRVHLMRSHTLRDKLSLQPEVNGNTSDVSLPVDCSTCHQLTADSYASPNIKH